MAQVTDTHVDLDSYVKSNRADSSRRLIDTERIKGSLNRLPAWLKPQRTKETESDLDQAAESDPWFPTLNKQQRLLGFLACFTAGLVCLTVASFYIPILLLKSKKFAILFTFGSVFIIFSFALLRGPYNHLRSMFHADRLPLTSIYLLSVAATLFCALQIHSTLLTVLAGGVQVFTLIWYTLSYLPGGQTGFKFFTKITSSLLTKTANNALSV